MLPDRTILGFDTSAAHCAAALLSGGEIVAARTEAILTGQAERLVPMLEELLAERRLAWNGVGALAVGIGPGNFTGVRISVAAARGLALALGIPAIGVSAFEVMAGAEQDRAGPVLVSIPAPRELSYVQPFLAGAPSAPPLLVDPAGLQRGTGATASHVVGYRAAEIARQIGASCHECGFPAFAETLARRAARRLAGGEAPARPAPLYVRPADAALSSEPPLRILDDAGAP